MSVVQKPTPPNLGRRFVGTLERFLPVPYQPYNGWPLVDLVIAGVLGTIAIVIVIYAFGRLDPRLYSDPSGFNVWFEADTPRALGAMTNAGPKYQHRNDVHPIFSLVTVPLMAGLKALGVSTLDAARGMVATCGFLAVALLFLSIRGMRVHWLPATLFTAAFLASATFVHWFAVAETWAFAALSVSIVLFVLTRIGSSNWLAWVLASAFSLAIIVTNWSVALAAAIVRLHLRRAISTSLAALLLVAGLAIIQMITIPGSPLFFMPTAVIEEYRNTQIRNNVWSPLTNVWSTVVTGAVAPAPYVDLHRGPGQVFAPIVDNQKTSLSSYGPAALVAIASWLAMLACGLLGGVEKRSLRAVFAAVSLFLAGQLLLYLVYGNLTFLYATNYFAAMILLVALGWFSSMRYLAVTAAAVFVVAGGWSNFMQFEAAADLANSILRGP